MVWICPTQATNDAIEEKFLYVGLMAYKGKGQAKEDVDGSSKDRFEVVLPIKKHHMHKISVVEMSILRWMCGKTRKDRVRNERFWEHFGAAYC